jgi:hypothetical protein
VDTGIFSPLWGVQATLQPVIAAWAGTQLISVSPSGSFSKGTANKSGTDIDLFISVSETTRETLKQIYDIFSTVCGQTPEYFDQHARQRLQCGPGVRQAPERPSRRSQPVSPPHG